MRLKEILSPEAICIHGEAADQLEAIGKLVQLQKKNGCLQDESTYRSAIYAREDVTSTALDGGIAIPHAKSKAISKPCVSFATFKKGVEWGAYDHSKSDLLFMIGAPMEGNEHLRLLTYITTLLAEVPALADQLRKAETVQQVYDCIEAAELHCFGKE